MPLNLDPQSLVVPGGVVSGLGDIGRSLVSGWLERERRREQAKSGESELAFKRWLAEQEMLRHEDRMALDKDRLRFDATRALADYLKRSGNTGALDALKLRASLYEAYIKDMNTRAGQAMPGTPFVRMTFDDWLKAADIVLPEFDPGAAIRGASDSMLRTIVSGGDGVDEQVIAALLASAGIVPSGRTAVQGPPQNGNDGNRATVAPNPPVNARQDGMQGNTGSPGGADTTRRQIAGQTGKPTSGVLSMTNTDRLPNSAVVDFRLGSPPLVQASPSVPSEEIERITAVLAGNLAQSNDAHRAYAVLASDPKTGKKYWEISTLEGTNTYEPGDSVGSGAPPAIPSSRQGRPPVAPQQPTVSIAPNYVSHVATPSAPPGAAANAALAQLFGVDPYNAIRSPSEVRRKDVNTEAGASYWPFRVESDKKPAPLDVVAAIRKLQARMSLTPQEQDALMKYAERVPVLKSLIANALRPNQPNIPDDELISTIGPLSVVQ